MSPRTLQRRCAEEGTSFRALRDEARLTLAKGLLCSTEQSVGEIAFSLGFSSPASFVRAFRRWTGGTPGTFRKAASRLEARKGA